MDAIKKILIVVLIFLTILTLTLVKAYSQRSDQPIWVYSILLFIGASIIIILFKYFPKRDIPKSKIKHVVDKLELRQFDFCFNCGVKSSVNSKFCHNCGTELKADSNGLSDEPKTILEKKENVSSTGSPKNLVWIKIAFYISTIFTSLLILLIIIASMMKGSMGGILLGGGGAFILSYFFSTFPFVKKYPESLDDADKILTTGRKISGYVSIFNGVLLIGGGILLAILSITDPPSFMNSRVSGFLSILVYITPLLLYGWALLYYVISTFILFKNQVVMDNMAEKEITIKYKVNDRIETVSIERWNLMKDKYGEENYEVLEGE